MVLCLNPSNWNFRSWVKLWAMPHLYSSSLRLNLEVSAESVRCRVKTRLPLALACEGLHEKDRFRVFGLSESLLLPISKGYLEINWIKTWHNWVDGNWRQWIILLCPWNFSGKNAGLGCHFLLQGIFLTQGLNPGLLHLLHGQADSLPLSHLGIPAMTWRVCHTQTAQPHPQSLWFGGSGVGSGYLQIEKASQGTLMLISEIHSHGGRKLGSSPRPGIRVTQLPWWLRQ